MNKGPLQPEMKTVELSLEARELRSRCLAELKERVQQGLYHVPSHALAEKLLLAALQECRTGTLIDTKQGGNYAGSKSGSENSAEGLMPADADGSSVGIRLRSNCRT